MKIVTIINYCTNDYMFLKPCIDGARPFSSEIIVPYCDHFNDGTPENRELLNKSVEENQGVQFIEFNYEPSQSSRWHSNAARKIGIEAAAPDTDYFLLLDTDEIVEPDKFTQWMKEQENNLMDSYKLANYFYFRETKYRSKNIEDSIVLVKKGPMTENNALIFHDEERFGLWYYTDKKQRMCMFNGKPFIHHYSWVRSREAMLKKVTAWSHNKDKDWVSLVLKEFEQPFRGKDVIFGDREYETVEPYIHLDMGIQILDTGAWNWNDSKEDHSCNLDTGLMDYLLEFLKGKNQKIIMDFGCATGYFLKYISERTDGMELVGVEAHASKNSNLYYKNILDHDLSVPFDLNKKGSIICIEVLEHIPAQFEKTAIDNIIRHCDAYLFLSWAFVGQGGHGHYNEKNMSDVMEIFKDRGFSLLVSETNEARARSKMPWLKNNFAIFKNSNIS